VYEETVKEITDIIIVMVDKCIWMAQYECTGRINRTGLIGADVCHLNLHKTFAIPHGGGGPGMGPICKSPPETVFTRHVEFNGLHKKVAMLFCCALWFSFDIAISYAYIRMLGAEGVKAATDMPSKRQLYARKIGGSYDILYLGTHGTCAHEFIVDLRPFKKAAEVEAEDIAKRLIDYGFHAPTMSFPVPGTIMIEPTESEDKGELDRFCDALLSIRKEIEAIENGAADKKENALKNAPHTQAVVISSNWSKPYTREEAAFHLIM
jgi:glycine dehydrogenase